MIIGTADRRMPLWQTAADAWAPPPPPIPIPAPDPKPPMPNMGIGLGLSGAAIVRAVADNGRLAGYFRTGPSMLRIDVLLPTKDRALERRMKLLLTSAMPNRRP